MFPHPSDDTVAQSDRAMQQFDAEKKRRRQAREALAMATGYYHLPTGFPR